MMRMAALLKNRLILAALLALSCSVQAQDAAPPERAFLVDDQASYQDTGSISDAAKTECQLERLIPQAVEKFGPKYKVQVALGQASTASDPANRVSLQITTLVGGRASVGFGGRWVESEVGMNAAVAQGGREIAKTNFSCKAGLGANPFANFKACDRLERCAEQLGAKTARWLKTVARKADTAPASPEAAANPDSAASE